MKTNHRRDFVSFRVGDLVETKYTFYTTVKDEWPEGSRGIVTQNGLSGERVLVLMAGTHFEQVLFFEDQLKKIETTKQEEIEKDWGDPEADDCS